MLNFLRVLASDSDQIILKKNAKPDQLRLVATNALEFSPVLERFKMLLVRV